MTFPPMTFLINQWTVGVKGEVKYMFTPYVCDDCEALAIAQRTFGEIEWLQDNAAVRVYLTDAQIAATPLHAPGVDA